MVDCTKQAHKAHTNNLSKAQQMSIIANGARQQWSVRFPWRIKDMRDWHVEAHGWWPNEGKGPLGKGEWVGLVCSWTTER